MFKVGDVVHLSPKGVKTYSGNNWAGYSVPLAIYLHGGVVTNTEVDLKGKNRVFAKALNGVPSVWFEEDDLVLLNLVGNSPVKSDGGASSYYEKQIVRLSDGETFKCQTGDIIRSMVNNDFDGGNILKALDRIFQNIQGKGKEGTSIEYDCNKIIYFANVIKERFRDA